MELEKCIPKKFSEKEGIVKVLKDRFQLSKKIAKEVKWNYCKVYHAKMDNGKLVLFVFTNKKDSETFKVCRHNSVIRICVSRLAKELRGKVTNKYAWLDNVLVVLFRGADL